jgi:hypothetical protein
MRSVNKAIVIAAVGVLSAGCVVVPTYEVYRPAPLPPPEPAVVVEPAPVVVAGPVFEAPGVEVIDVEPAPEFRVYCYDPGYPPGCYFYNDCYWYGGYRYPHDVFINRYVTVNVRERRFIDVEANRRQGMQIEERHRAEFAQNHGVRRPEDVRQAEHDRVARPGARPAAARPAAAHQQRAPQQGPPHY